MCRLCTKIVDIYLLKGKSGYLHRYIFQKKIRVSSIPVVGLMHTVQPVDLKACKKPGSVCISTYRFFKCITHEKFAF